MSELSKLLNDSLGIMDERGRGVEGNSRVLWQREWDELRLNIFKALELELLITRKSRSLLQQPVKLTEGKPQPFKRNMPPPIKHH